MVIARNDLAIEKSYLISVPLTQVSQGSEIIFGVNNVLNPEGNSSVIFTGLEVYTATYLSNDPSGNPVVTLTDAPQLSVTLVWDDVEFVKDYAYNGFNSSLNFGMIRRLNHVKIDLTKSYVKIVGSTVTLDNSAVFNFFYMDAPGHHDHHKK